MVRREVSKGISPPRNFTSPLNLSNFNNTPTTDDSLSPISMSSLTKTTCTPKCHFHPLELESIVCRRTMDQKTFRSEVIRRTPPVSHSSDSRIHISSVRRHTVSSLNVYPGTTFSTISHDSFLVYDVSLLVGPGPVSLCHWRPTSSTVHEPFPGHHTK